MNKIAFRLIFVCSMLYLLSACEWRVKHTAPGYVEVAHIYLSSPFGGTLLERPVSQGDLVQRGGLVFKLDPNPEALAVKEISHLLEQEISLYNDLKKPARAPKIGVVTSKLDQIDAQLALSQLRMKRFEILYQKKAGTLDAADAALQHFKELLALKKQSEYELDLVKLGAREDKVLAQSAKVKLVRAKIDLFKWKVAQKSKYAPIDGIVFDTFYAPGEWVPPGRAIVGLYRPDDLWITFFVTSKQFARIKLGQKLKAHCSGCLFSQTISVEFISPVPDYGGVLLTSKRDEGLMFRVKARPENPKLFKPGQPISVTGF